MDVPVNRKRRVECVLPQCPSVARASNNLSSERLVTLFASRSGGRCGLARSGRLLLINIHCVVDSSAQCALGPVTASGSSMIQWLLLIEIEKEAGLELLTAAEAKDD